MSENGKPITETGVDPEILAPEDPLAVIPPESRVEIVNLLFSSFMSFFSSGSTADPLFSKFNEEHTTQFLDQVQKSEERAHELQKTDRRILVAIVLLFVLVFCAGVIYLLPRDKELLLLLIQFLVLLAGGIGTGVGITSRRSRS